MPVRTMFAPFLVAIGAISVLSAPVLGDDLLPFQKSVADLARLSRPSYDPDYLAGIGQIYCQMKQVVGDEPLAPDTVLAVLHQKHPDTQPKSKAERDVQWKAMSLAGTLLCPERPRSRQRPIERDRADLP